jgi:hypothetical protein
MGADDNRPWSALAVHHPGFPLLTAKTLNAIGRLAPGTAAKNSALAEALTQAGIDKDSIGAAIGDCLQGEPPRKTQAGRSRRSLPASGRALSTAASSCFAASQPRKAAAVPLLPGGKWRRLTNPPGRQIDCGTLGGARIGAAKAYRDYSGNRAFGRLLSVGALARVRFRVALMYWTKPARVLDFHDGW